MSGNKKIVKFLFRNALGFEMLNGINRFIEKKSTEENILKPVSGHYYEWKLGDIYYKTYGKGTPLLLIHDLDSSSSSYEWSKTIRFLSKKYKVYVPDLLGCGRSDKPNIIYTGYLYVQLIESFISNVIKEPAFIAATGLSSSFAIMASISYPEKIRKLLLINPPATKRLKKQSTYSSQISRGLVRIPVVGNSIYNLITRKGYIENRMKKKYFVNTHKILQKDVNAYYEAAHLDHGKGRYLRASIDGSFLNTDLQRALKVLTCPTCIIYGNKWSEGYKAAAEYQKLQPSIRKYNISESRFLPQLENPEHFSLILEKAFHLLDND